MITQATHGVADGSSFHFDVDDLRDCQWSISNPISVPYRYHTVLHYCPLSSSSRKCVTCYARSLRTPTSPLWLDSLTAKPVLTLPQSHGVRILILTSLGRLGYGYHGSLTPKSPVQPDSIELGIEHLSLSIHNSCSELLKTSRFLRVKCDTPR